MTDDKNNDVDEDDNDWLMIICWSATQCRTSKWWICCGRSRYTPASLLNDTDHDDDDDDADDDDSDAGANDGDGDIDDIFH